MKKLYYLSERNGIWQLKDATTGKRESLKTTSKAEAMKLADAKYEGASDVRFNTRMAQTWLEKVDPKSIKRTWADVIDAKCKLVKGGTKERWERVKKSKGFKPIINLVVVDTKPDHFLQVLNSYVVPTNGTSILFTTVKPFDFVFLDGCMTGTGSFPEAFGIPKAVAGLTYDNNHKHKRAFMGWGGTVSLSILDNDSLNWSLEFWNSWLGDSSKSLVSAQSDAYAAHPGAASGAPLKTYGNNSLKWSD